MKSIKQYCTRKLFLAIISILMIVECYSNVLFYYSTIKKGPQASKSNRTMFYEYPLKDATKTLMDYKNYSSSFDWFMSMKHLFMDIGDEGPPKYTKNTPTCHVEMSSLSPIKVNKTARHLKWVEEQNSDVKLGGYYAPAHCRAEHRVALIVPYRNRKVNLNIFLYYLHPLLKKQLLEYRIFVIEQHGTEMFNKGTLFNIAFLESQRFGVWDCLILHDVDLIPEDERISYACPKQPTHMGSGVESLNYVLPYRTAFGGVTALTPAHYRAVNGFSNFYLDWGAEDDDFYGRLSARNFTILRYNRTIARYASLDHKKAIRGHDRNLLLMTSRSRFRQEGLRTTKYNLISVTKKKLYTHILADVNPTNMKYDSKSLLKNMLNLNGKQIIYGNREVLFARPHKL